MSTPATPPGPTPAPTHPPLDLGEPAVRVGEAGPGPTARPDASWIARPPLSGWGARFGAYLVDYVLSCVPIVLGLLLVTVVLTVGADPGTEPTTALSALIATIGMLGLVGSVGVQIWNRGVRQGRTGRSLGKSAFRIRLVRELDGGTVGTGTALVRELAHVLDAVLYLGFLWPLWDARAQTFADKAVSTVVVRT